MNNLEFDNTYKLKTSQKSQIKSAPRFLIIDDDITMQPLFEHVIKSVNPRSSVTWAITEQAAEDAIIKSLRKIEQFDIVICDIFLSGHRTGIELWKRYAHSGIDFLFISAIEHKKFKRMIGESNYYPIYLKKPINPDECSSLIKAMLEYTRVRR